MTGFEPLIGAATVGLAGLIGNVIKDKGGDLLDKADIDLFRGVAFNQAIQKYVQRYAERHGLLKVACVRMDSPIKLDDIYTAVQLLPRSACAITNPLRLWKSYIGKVGSGASVSRMRRSSRA
jgi:hypothetical protein